MQGIYFWARARPGPVSFRPGPARPEGKGYFSRPGPARARFSKITTPENKKIKTQCNVTNYIEHWEHCTDICAAAIKILNLDRKLFIGVWNLCKKSFTTWGVKGAWLGGVENPPKKMDPPLIPTKKNLDLEKCLKKKFQRVFRTVRLPRCNHSIGCSRGFSLRTSWFHSIQRAQKPYNRYQKIRFCEKTR